MNVKGDEIYFNHFDLIFSKICVPKVKYLKLYLDISEKVAWFSKMLSNYRDGRCLIAFVLDSEA